MASYFSLDGRISRGPWWMVVLPVGIVLGILYAIVNPQGDSPNTVAVLILAVVWVVALWLNVAATVKRYHDRGKSGWWWFIALVPLVGGIWQLIECGFLAGTPGPNQYGPQP